jgi:hypothetical protein
MRWRPSVRGDRRRHGLVRTAGVRTTATIIVLVPHVGAPWVMFGSRIGEVGWGVSVAVVTVWLAARIPSRYLRRRAAPAK